jgi:glycosyltransferase involved in cell wall biosynthesis
VVALGPGVPVVGTAVDGLARTLGGGRGVLVSPEAPYALAEALSRVLGGERPGPGPGRANARQFTPVAAAAVYAGAYRQLLAGRARFGGAKRGAALKPTSPEICVSSSGLPS